MTSFLHSNRLTTSTNDFIAALNLARSEAIKTGTAAGVCRSDNATSCTASGTWESGWIVFADPDRNGPWTASDFVIRAYEGTPAGITLTVVTGSAAIVYDRQGLVPSADPEFEYRTCSSKIGKSRTLRINSVGRTQLAEGTC